MVARLHACQASRRLGTERRDRGARREGAVEPVQRDRRQLLGGQAKGVRTPRQLFAERDPGHGPVVRRHRHAHARSVERGKRVLGQRGHDARLDVRGRAQVERDIAGSERIQQRGILDRGHPMRHPPDAEVQYLPHPLRAGHLARVGRQREAGLARGHERDRMWRRRPRGLGPGEVEPDDAAAERPGDSRELGVRGRRVGSQCGDDQGDKGRVRSGRGRGDPGRHRLDHGRHRQPALEVEAWCPADLRVPHAIGGQVLEQLGGGAFERLGRLEQRDRQVEEGQQLGLVGASLRGDHPAGRLLERKRHADVGGQLQGRRRPHRAVEVLVELRLRQPPDDLEVHSAMIGRRLVAAAVAIALIVTLGAGAPRPEIARDANAAIVAAADDTLEAIDRLEASWRRPWTRRAPVRRGSLPAKRIRLSRWWRRRRASSRPLPRRRSWWPPSRSWSALEAALRPDARLLPPAPDAGQLESIASQLADTAEAGARSRGSAEAASRSRRASSTRSTRSRPAGSTRRTSSWQASLAAVNAVRELEEGAPTLSVWIDTADAMIRAVQELVEAVRTTDPGRADAARAAFDAAAEGAPQADRSLRIGLGETGNAISSVPLRRLAEVHVALRELEAAVQAEMGG